jgi:hypothetical protein
VSGDAKGGVAPAGTTGAAGDPHRTSNPRAERFRAIGPYLTAAVLAIKGGSKLDHPDGHRFLIGACLASAAVIVAVTALHSKLHAYAAKVEALVYALEAVVAGTMAVVTVQEGKHGCRSRGRSRRRDSSWAP